MTVFPLQNYDTFISVDDMTVALTQLGSNQKWDVLTIQQKEVMLSKSGFLIKSICTISEFSTCSFADAQIAIIQADQANIGRYLTSEIELQEYTKAKIGSLSVEYRDISKEDTVDSLPSIVKSLLQNCLKSTNQTARGFKIA